MDNICARYKEHLYKIGNTGHKIAQTFFCLLHIYCMKTALLAGRVVVSMPNSPLPSACLPCNRHGRTVSSVSSALLIRPIMFPRCCSQCCRRIKIDVFLGLMYFVYFQVAAQRPTLGLFICQNVSVFKFRTVLKS